MLYLPIFEFVSFFYLLNKTSTNSMKVQNVYLSLSLRLSCITADLLEKKKPWNGTYI